MQSARGVPAGDTGLFCARTGALPFVEKRNDIRNAAINAKVWIPSPVRDLGAAALDGVMKKAVGGYEKFENSEVRQRALDVAKRGRDAFMNATLGTALRKIDDKLIGSPYKPPEDLEWVPGDGWVLKPRPPGW